MSGPRGFHHSQGDATRSFAGSRALGYEKTRGGMAGILSHDNIESRAPPPRDSGSMAALLEQEAPEAPPTARTQQARSAMDDVMQGVGQIGVDDSRYGIGRRTLNEAHMGAGALAVLRGEEAEKGMDDPFSMSRKPKPLDAAGWAMGKAPPAPAKPSDPAAGLRIHRPDVMAEATADVRGMLGGRKAGAASLVANQGIVDLLNGGSSQHGRKSDIGITVGKSSQFR